MGISLSTPETLVTALCCLSLGPGVSSLNSQLLAQYLFQADRRAGTPELPPPDSKHHQTSKELPLLSSLPKFTIPQGCRTCTPREPERQPCFYRIRVPLSPTGPLLRPLHAMDGLSPSKFVTERRVSTDLQGQTGSTSVTANACGQNSAMIQPQRHNGKFLLWLPNIIPNHFRRRNQIFLWGTTPPAIPVW